MGERTHQVTDLSLQWDSSMGQRDAKGKPAAVRLELRVAIDNMPTDDINVGRLSIQHLIRPRGCSPSVRFGALAGGRCPSQCMTTGTSLRSDPMGVTKGTARKCIVFIDTDGDTTERARENDNARL